MPAFRRGPGDTNRACALLLPGLDGTGRLFRWLVPALEPELPSRVVSYPTHRRLRCPELAELVLQQIPSDPFVIVAESYSGMVGLAVAARRPSGLLGLILSTAVTAPPMPRWVRLIPFGALLRLQPPAFLLRYLLLDRGSSADVLTEVRNAIRDVSPDVLVGRLHEVLDSDGRELVRTCPVPLVCLAAAHDRLIGRRGLRVIQSVRPDIATVLIDGPHCLLQTRAAESAAVILRYARRWRSAAEDYPGAG